MNTAYHAATIVTASDQQVRAAIESWMTANRFSRTSPRDGIPIIGSRGSGIGLTDNQTKRIIELILKPHGEVVAVSVFHHTTTFLLATGAMFGNVLQDEVEDLFNFIQNQTAAASL